MRIPHLLFVLHKVARRMCMRQQRVFIKLTVFAASLIFNAPIFAVIKGTIYIVIKVAPFYRLCITIVAFFLDIGIYRRKQIKRLFVCLIIAGINCLFGNLIKSIATYEFFGDCLSTIWYRSSNKLACAASARFRNARINFIFGAFQNNLYFV